MRALVFGASITQGFWDTEGGWVNRLRRHYDSQVIKGLHPEENYPTVFNLGISGDSTKGVLKRFNNEAKARVWPGEEFKSRFEAGEDLFADGLHPSDAGHELIFQLVCPELDKLLS